MKTNFKHPLIKKLWELSGEIGAVGESEGVNGGPYTRLYRCLSEALDSAEFDGLIVNEECEHEHGTRGGICEDCGKCL